jgi:hypothetical protein
MFEKMMPSATWTVIVPVVMLFSDPLFAAPKATSYWNVDDIRQGMKGTGHTVMKGTKIEEFQAEVLGVLKNTSPGRDLILCRLSGLDLDKTGVIAGMSGSPIYVEGKLLGAVAYAWAYGKEPIAGITPFSQMHRFVESFELRDTAEKKDPMKLGLKTPLKLDGRDFDRVSVSRNFDQPKNVDPSELWLTPLQTPVATTGFTAHSLKLFREQFGSTGLVPMQGGGTLTKIMQEEAETPLKAGGPLSVSLVTGDFDMSGIGTTTHIEEDRVYGWGHPFMSLGGCDLPLMTGYIHTVYPRQTVSFKMGSPLKMVGVVNADVSTGIAGWLGRKPDMLPVSVLVRLGEGQTQTFNVQTVRQKQLLPSLIFAVLTNSIDMEGELPEELTADISVKIHLANRQPIVIHDTFAGPSISGGRAPLMLFAPISQTISQLINHPFDPIRIEKIDAKVEIRSGRNAADIETVEVDADVYRPGEKVQALVHLRPYRGEVVKQRVSFQLPNDLADGTYTISISDDAARARAEMRDLPHLWSPASTERLLESVHFMNEGKRTTLSMRLPLKDMGVSMGAKALPNLPKSMVQMMAQTRKADASPIHQYLTSKEPVPWVLVGSTSFTIKVTRNKRTGLELVD